ncbi:serine hydrolase [Couchioplanes caeruleus]|uniref:serine hydrolase n=1 Tax=Couchioplanes caeruleus TaxID=56438 RepID=UPI0008FF0C58|nr:serine hydrolase [Couchioplanes caeruleus]
MSDANHLVQSSSPLLDASHWQQRLDVLAEKHGVAGAVLGILHGDDMVQAASGVTNLRTGDPVHTDTVFQIGSITKVYTATAAAALRLVPRVVQRDLRRARRGHHAPAPAAAPGAAELRHRATRRHVPGT